MSDQPASGGGQGDRLAPTGNDASPNASADLSMGQRGHKVAPFSDQGISDGQVITDNRPNSGPRVRPGNQQDARNSDRSNVDSPLSELKSARQFLEDPDKIKQEGDDKKLNNGKPTDEKASGNLTGMTKSTMDELGQFLQNDDIGARKFDGVFHCNGVPYMFAKTSLCCLTDRNPLRKGLVYLMTNKWFDIFVTVAIVLNSFMLASTDYNNRLDPSYESSWTPIQEKIDLGFSIIFILEASIKITAMGFFFHKKTYLREAWNCLDFLIVCISIIGMLPLGAGSDSLKALRTFRILRPLRSINKLDTMRDQISSLLASIPGLMRVFFFIIFIFCIFAIFGTNQFLGQQYSFCRATEEATKDEDGNFVIWEKQLDDDDSPRLCATSDDCKDAFPDAKVHLCGRVYEEYGLDPIEYDDIRNIELIMYGIPGFDNVAQGFLTIFQILTLESWVYLMYNYSDTGTPAISIIFFILVVLLGAFFTMNLVLAIIVDSFSSQEEKKQKDKEQKEEEESLQNESKKMEAELSRSGALKKDQPPISQADAINIVENNNQVDQVQDLGPVIESSSRNVNQGAGGSILPELSSKKTGEEAARRIAEAERARERGEHLLSAGSEPDDGVRSSQRKEPSNREPQPAMVIGESVSHIKAGEQSVENEEEVKRNLADLDFAPSSQGNQASKIQIIEQPYMHTSDMDFEDELEHEKDARVRSHQNGVYRCLYLLVTSVSFNFFIFLLIIGNTITLAAYTYDQSDLQTDVLEVFNEFFTWTFLLEMILKIIGLGFHNYRKDNYNLFDAVIVIISLIDWTISRIPSINAGSALNAFRALRLLRMMKLSKSWKALAEILRKTGKSLKDISNFSLLLILFMYIFALLGMELFAFAALINEDDDLIAGESNIQELYLSGDYYAFPRDNFNNVGYALTTVFIVIIGEDWNWVMYQWVRAYGYGSSVSYHIAVFYFLMLMIMGNIVLFSLFTAILLRNFDDEGGDEEDEEEEDEEEGPKKSFKETYCSKEAWQKVSDGFKEAFGKKRRKQAILNSDGEQINPEKPAASDKKTTEHARAQGEDEFDDQFESVGMSKLSQDRDKEPENRKVTRVSSLMHYQPEQSIMMRVSTIRQSTIKEELPPLMGKSLFCLGPENPFRLLCYKIAENKYFVNGILVLIIISTVTLAMETPLDDPKGEKVTILNQIDFGMTMAFTLEALIKIIALGFAFAGKMSYIRDPWNILDFIIVLSALLGIIAGDAIKISFIKALRIMKILRPLRIIARNQELKVAIMSLGRSIPNIFRLQIIVLFFVFLLAILQTTLLSGQFSYCETEHLGLSAKQIEAHVTTMWDCYNYGGEWITPDLNFDTTVRSVLTLVTIQTTEGWIDVMWASVDAVAPYYQPKENNNPFMIVYTMIIIIIVCMLFMELFVGIVTETFNTQKELLVGNTNLTRSQRSWIAVQLLCLTAVPKKKLQPQGTNKLRDAMIIVTEHPAFDLTIMICIMLNTAVLAFVWYMQPDSFKQPLEAINYTFMAIFTVEAIMKIIAQKLDYFKDSWNRFDFTVVVATIIILILQWAKTGLDLQIMGTILRTLRIGRVFRLIKKQQKLQEIFKTLLQALPAMASLGLLLMLLIFMFSIIGMSMFALVDIDGAGEMNRHVNFQQFGAAFLTLVRCSTGEAWNSIMFDSSQSYSILYQCEENESYESIVADGRDPNDPYGPKGCGTDWAIGFHLFFQIIVSQVFLNLFIAIIIDAFFGQTDLASIPVKEKTIEDFQRIWQSHDVNGTGFIDIGQLSDLLIDLAKADPEEAGALIPFKKRIAGSQKFRNRQIVALDLPTYGGMKQVMFYDVLMKLSYQQVKIHFQKDKIQKMRRKLRVIKMIGADALNDDTLEAINSHKLADSQFDREFNDLVDMMNEIKPKAAMIGELKEKNKKLTKEYNHIVDTNLKIFGREDKAKQMLEKGENLEIELVTTAHFGSALIIHDFILEYIQQKKRMGQPIHAGQAPSRLSQAAAAPERDINTINEVSEHQERTQEQARNIELNVASTEMIMQEDAPGIATSTAPVLLPSAGQQPMSGSVERDPEGAPDQNDSSVVPDQDWRNFR